jgi:hypothetical protein
VYVAPILDKPLIVEAKLPGEKVVGKRASLYRLGLLLVPLFVIGVIVNAVIDQSPIPSILLAFLDDDSHVLPRLVQCDSEL